MYSPNIIINILAFLKSPQVNISSLVEVVKNYISLAEEKTEAARKESHQTVVDIDDLDLPDSPER